MYMKFLCLILDRSKEVLGKRCRVLLGQTGSDYLFLADNDDGNITWQSHEWNVNSFNGIPGRLINRINECSETGQKVTDISFGTVGGDCFMKVENLPDWWDVSGSFTEALMKHSNLEKKVSVGDNGSWLILYGHNGYSYSYDNLSSDILARLDENKGKIDFVRLLPYGQCFISYSDDTPCEWKLTGNENLSQELSCGSSDPVTDVALARDGSWVVLRENGYLGSSGISIELRKHVKNFYSVHEERVREQEKQRELEEEDDSDDDDYNQHHSRRQRRRRRRRMNDDITDREAKRRRVGDLSSSIHTTSQSNRTDSNTNSTRNDDESLDLKRCVEKIDIKRLKQIKENLATDSFQRRQLLTLMNFCPILGELERKKLQSCSDMEDLVKKLYDHVKDLPCDTNGFVEYKVDYVHKDLSKKGRLYAEGIQVGSDHRNHPRTTTLQGMHKDLRAPLVGSFAHDIDCVNSEVNLLCSLAIKLNMKYNVPTLFDYRDRRQEWMSSIRSVHGVSESDAKLLSTIVLNGGQYDSWKRKVSIEKETTNQHIKDFVNKLKSEVGKILFEAMYNDPNYSWLHYERMELIQTKTFKSRESRESSLAGMLIRHCENEVLNIIHRCFFDNSWTVRAKIFDGLIVEKSDGASSSSSLEQVMTNAEACCESEGWYVELAEKPLHGRQDDPIRTIKEASKITQGWTGDVYHMNIIF